MSYPEDASDRLPRDWRDPRRQRSDDRDEQPYPAEGTARSRASIRRPPINPWLFMIATTLNTTVAAVVAVVITINVLKQDRPNNQPGDTAPAATNTTPPTPLIAAPQPIVMPPIRLLPIGSSNQPLLLDAQKPAQLPLQIYPEEAAREPYILALSGAPVGTALFGATQMGSDTWFLPPGSSNQLEIVLPEGLTSVFEITIALRRTTGRLAAQTTAWIAVRPPVTAKAANVRIDDAAARDLLEKANQLLEKGDVVAARAAYQRAAEMGNGSAALMLGSTYDPKRLWSLGILGMVGNKERARQWYTRAGELGNPEAKARLMALGN